MTTSTWRCGILWVLCSSKADTIFSMTSPSVSQGVSSCFCQYSTATTMVQVNYNLETSVTQLAFQFEWQLLRCPHSIGASSCPSCDLPASTGLCPCTHGRGKLVEYILPKQLILPFQYEFCPSLWQRYEPMITIAEWKSLHTQVQAKSVSTFLFHNNVSFFLSAASLWPRFWEPNCPSFIREGSRLKLL